jgi:hypothetical protein
MNNLVIIGNGFDLAHGLKTSYSDFILWYYNNALKLALANGVYEDDLIKVDASRSPFVATFSMNSIDELDLTLSRAKYQLSNKSDFFSTLRRKWDNRKWVDIETLYYEELVKIHNGLKRSIMQNEIKDWENTLISLNKSLNCLKYRLSEYLATIQTDTVVVNKAISASIDLIMESVNIRENKNPFIKPKVCFLNFNYTSTISKYLVKYKTEDYNYEVLNIHGNLNNVDSIIFGYGDMMDPHYEHLENTNDNQFLDHIKHFYYLQLEEYHKLIRFIESGNSGGKLGYHVNIMGHSCGISDRVLLNRIFSPVTCHKINIFYYKMPDGKDDFFEKTQNISRHFNKEHKRNMEIINNKAKSSPLGLPK